MSNPEGHNQFTAGQVVRFAGKSADGKVIGAMDVKIINPHSNADQVGHTEGKGSKAREYNKDGSRHIPTATVERPAQSDRPAKQFEAHHFALSAISQKGINMSPYQDASPLTEMKKALSTTGLVSMAGSLQKSNPEGHNQYTGGGAKSQAHHILRQSDIMSAGLKITEDSAHPSALMNAQQDAMTSSSQAHSASANAMNTSNEDSEAAQNHINAANAHKEAAKDQTKAASMSRNAGDKKAAATHEKLASESKTLAAFHSDQAKSTKKSK